MYIMISENWTKIELGGLATFSSFLLLIGEAFHYEIIEPGELEIWWDINPTPIAANDDEILEESVQVGTIFHAEGKTTVQWDEAALKNEKWSWKEDEIPDHGWDGILSLEHKVAKKWAQNYFKKNSGEACPRELGTLARKISGRFADALFFELLKFDGASFHYAEFIRGAKLLETNLTFQSKCASVTQLRGRKH